MFKGGWGGQESSLIPYWMLLRYIPATKDDYSQVEVLGPLPVP